MADWYVATTGDDGTGDGSEGNPWKTLDWATRDPANTDTVTGDTIIVAAGTYIENYSGTNSWRWGSKGLTITANGVVIVKATHGTDTGIFNNVMYISGTTTNVINGITFDADDGTDNKGQCVYMPANATGVTFNNCIFRNASISAIKMLSDTTAVFNGCTFQDGSINIIGTPASGIDLTFDNCGFTVSGNSRWIHFGGKNLTVRNGCTVTATSTPTDHLALLDTNTSLGTILIDNLTLTHNQQTPDVPIHFDGGNWDITITDSSFTFSNTTINWYVHKIRIDNPNNVTFERNIMVSAEKTATGSMISIISAGRACSPKVNYNVFDHWIKDGFTILFGWDSSTAYDNKLDGAEVIGNKIYGRRYNDPTYTQPLGNHGIMIGFIRNATVMYNYVNGAGYGVVTKHDGGAATANWTSGGVFYNVFVDNKQGGIRIKGVRGTKYYGNTIWNPHTDNWKCVAMTANLAGENSVNIDLRNNIFGQSFSVAGIHCIRLGDTSQTFSNIDNNLYYAIDGTMVYGQINTTDYTTWAGWQTAISGETNGIDNQDPDLEDTANEKYWLKDSSPCIDAGNNLGVSYDDALYKDAIFGVDSASIITKDQDNFGAGWEIGAYVYDLVKIINETLQISESLPRVSNTIRQLDETLQLSEGIVKIFGIWRIIAETVNINEGTLRFIGVFKQINETLQISETILRNMVSAKIVSESISWTESVIRTLSGGINKIIGETFQISEDVIKIFEINKLVNESLNLTETVLRNTGIFKLIDESMSWVESLIKVFAKDFFKPQLLNTTVKKVLQWIR